MHRTVSAPQLMDTTVDRDELKPGHEWVKNSDRLWCKLCAKKFTLFLRKHHCRMCGDVFCSACTTFVTIVVRDEPKNSVRICGPCIAVHKTRYTSRRGPTTSLLESTPLARASKSVSVPSSSTSIAMSAPGHRMRPRHEGTPLARHRKSNSGIQDITLPKASTWHMYDLVDARLYPETYPWEYKWPRPPTSAFESDRAAILRSLNLDVRIPDNICDLLCKGYECPMAGVSFIDESTQYYKSRVGIVQDEMALHLSPCAYTICGRDPFVVLNLADDVRFKAHPLVTVAGVLFYAGAPLVTDGGIVIGTVFVMDTKPRKSCFDTCLTSMARMALHQIMDKQDALIASSLSASSRLGSLHQTDVTPRQVESILVNLLSKTNDIQEQLRRPPPRA
ncbi:Aste57867_1811 [Aphanomyces stellatus]|uniref:Aste57867_1811 protein n=1 Tax=Aphanomyces stellatus TaxID=120398 RepID=A0A485KBH7_9STRA|nr:hypothetical protein As57867_001809 [Aphanomyces stellatus]VFT79020.1 Aste57867_1811 [Aphanomyces stellatus]